MEKFNFFSVLDISVLQYNVTFNLLLFPIFSVASDFKMYTCQRRIEYPIIESISTSLISTEFTIHVPTQYDYRYKATSASDKNLILAVLSELSNVMTNKLDCFHTGNVTITKTQAKILSIDDRRKQIRQVSPPISHTPLVGSFYSRKTMSELKHQN